MSKVWYFGFLGVLGIRRCFYCLQLYKEAIASRVIFVLCVSLGYGCSKLIGEWVTGQMDN